MPPVVDTHAHYVAPALAEQIARGDFGPAVVARDTPTGRQVVFPTGTSRPLFPKMLDLDQRLAHLDMVGIDVQVLSTWADLYGYDLPEEVAVAYHIRVNEGLANAVQAHPDRFRFLASVPLPWGEAAARVLEDAVHRLGAVGCMIGTNIHGANLDSPQLEPLWAASERLGCPVQLHPINVAGHERLKAYYLENLLGNPFDTTIAATSLIFGGVLDRHPGLRIMLVHGGGYFPYAVGRLAHGYNVRPEAKVPATSPVAYLDRFYYDTVVFDTRIFQALIELVGFGRCVLGTDYPFDMEPEDVVPMVREVLGSQADTVLSSNAAAAFGGLDPR